MCFIYRPVDREYFDFYIRALSVNSANRRQPPSSVMRVLPASCFLIRLPVGRLVAAVPRESLE